MGMGNASVASVNDATASYYNPANLTLLSAKEANLMHSEQFGGLENYNSFSVAAPLSETGYAGITLLYLGVGDIKYTRVWDPSKAPGDSNRVEISSREDAADYALYISAAKKFSDKLAAGTSVKVIRRSVASDTAFGFGIDLGMRYAATQNWTFGVNLRDITGTTIAWDGHADDRIAPTMDAGVAYKDRMPLFGGRYVITASMLYFGDSPKVKGLKTMHAGFEYLMNDYIAFRAGSAEGCGTFGLGLMRLPLISSSSLDYAFLSHEEFESTHRISMTIRF
jgi:opacity protein-like surface antigen